jgi:hypothetical protein
MPEAEKPGTEAAPEQARNPMTADKPSERTDDDASRLGTAADDSPTGTAMSSPKEFMRLAAVSIPVLLPSRGELPQHLPHRGTGKTAPPSGKTQRRHPRQGNRKAGAPHTGRAEKTAPPLPSATAECDNPACCLLPATAAVYPLQVAPSRMRSKWKECGEMERCRYEEMIGIKRRRGEERMIRQ